MINISYVENSNGNPYKIYYVLGLAILIAVSLYWLVFASDGELTEQKCLNLFSLYESSIGNAELSYDNGSVRYEMGDSLAILTFSEESSGCVLYIQDRRPIKGRPIECFEGFEMYVYGEEHGNYYETEFVTGNFTSVELISKIPEAKTRFERIRDGDICGGNE